MKSRNLVLVRHGQSEWNAKNLFTGWKDPGLTDQGLAEAKKAGKELTNQPELIYDTDEFWKELDHYRLINEL